MPLSEVSAGVQADIGRTLQISVVTGAGYGTVGQDGSGTRLWALAKPVAPEVLRDDAFVAWGNSAGGVRESEANEFEPLGGDSIKNSGDNSCDALDVAVGELMSATLL
jgi:hypothetical protein